VVRGWARGLKRDVVALWLAARDPRTPPVARLVALAVAGYAPSPIDLIPDVIPVIGQLDDLIVVPLGIALAIRLVPPELMAEFRARATIAPRPVSRLAAWLIILIWLAVAWLLWRLLAVWRG
jgi:uncharacterized membrane protein YkvA (DUF1232 family)